MLGALAMVLSYFSQANLCRMGLRPGGFHLGHKRFTNSKKMKTKKYPYEA